MFYANASIKNFNRERFHFNLYKIYGILIKKCNNMYVKKSVLKFKIDKGIIALIQ